MSDAQMKALHDAAAAAREGMGIEEPTAEEPAQDLSSNEAPEIDSPVEDPPETLEEPAEDPETGDGAEATEDEPAESDEAAAEDEEDGASQPGTTVYQQLNHIRSQKRDADAKIKQLLDAIGSQSPEEALTTINKLKENQPVPEAFVDFAKKNGIEDPKVLKGMHDIFMAETRREMQDALKPFQEQMTTVKSSMEETQQRNAWGETIAHMDGEWKEILPSITQQYKPTPEQAQQAHDLMAELAHSEKYHDKELAYVMWKEGPRFEEIFGAPKRKTMFQSRGAPRSAAPVAVAGSLPKSDGSHDSIMKAKAALSAIKNNGAFTGDEERI